MFHQVFIQLFLYQILFVIAPRVMWTLLILCLCALVRARLEDNCIPFLEMERPDLEIMLKNALFVNDYASIRCLVQSPFDMLDQAIQLKRESGRRFFRLVSLRPETMTIWLDGLQSHREAGRVREFDALLAISSSSEHLDMWLESISYGNPDAYISDMKVYKSGANIEKMVLSAKLVYLMASQLLREMRTRDNLLYMERLAIPYAVNEETSTLIIEILHAAIRKELPGIYEPLTLFFNLDKYITVFRETSFVTNDGFRLRFYEVFTGLALRRHKQRASAPLAAEFVKAFAKSNSIPYEASRFFLSFVNTPDLWTAIMHSSVVAKNSNFIQRLFLDMAVRFEDPSSLLEIALTHDSEQLLALCWGKWKMDLDLRHWVSRATEVNAPVCLGILTRLESQTQSLVVAEDPSMATSQEVEVQVEEDQLQNGYQSSGYEALAAILSELSFGRTSKDSLKSITDLKQLERIFEMAVEDPGTKPHVYGTIAFRMSELAPESAKSAVLYLAEHRIQRDSILEYLYGLFLKGVRVSHLLKKLIINTTGVDDLEVVRRLSECLGIVQPHGVRKWLLTNPPLTPYQLLTVVSGVEQAVEAARMSISGQEFIEAISYSIKNASPLDLTDSARYFSRPESEPVTEYVSMPPLAHVIDILQNLDFEKSFAFLRGMNVRDLFQNYPQFAYSTFAKARARDAPTLRAWVKSDEEPLVVLAHVHTQTKNGNLEHELLLDKTWVVLSQQLGVTFLVQMVQKDVDPERTTRGTRSLLVAFTRQLRWVEVRLLLMQVNIDFDLDPLISFARHRDPETRRLFQIKNARYSNQPEMTDSTIRKFLSNKWVTPGDLMIYYWRIGYHNPQRLARQSFKYPEPFPRRVLRFFAPDPQWFKVVLKHLQLSQEDIDALLADSPRFHEQCIEALKSYGRPGWRAWWKNLLNRLQFWRRSR